MPKNKKAKITNVFDLRDAILANHPNNCFFSPSTMKFFGDTYSSMRVLKHTAEITDSYGEIHTCYVLSIFHRPSWYVPNRTYSYFDVETFDRILPKDEA